MTDVRVQPISSKLAAETVIEHHYLHRRPPISHALGLYGGGSLKGVITFGVPPSRHLQKSACPSNPDLVLELNRLWVDDEMPRNTESWFVSRSLKLIPPRIVVSYADIARNHFGYVYRACNFYYSGWTDMDRRTPRYDYLPENPAVHTRDAFRNGFTKKVRRQPKAKYWITTGTRREQRDLFALCQWPTYDWKNMPPPGESEH